MHEQAPYERISLDEVHSELRVLNTEQITAVVTELREVKALLQTLVEMQTQLMGATSS